MGNISLPVNSFTLPINENTFGRVNLVGGGQLVNNSIFTNRSQIFLSYYTALSNAQVYHPVNVNIGTGFTILSSDATDTSTISYLLLSPASISGPFSDPTSIFILDDNPGHLTYGTVQMPQGSPNKVTVNTSYIGTVPYIMLSKVSGTAGPNLVSGYSIQNIVPGVSFDIVSTQTLDSSVISWFLLIGAYDGFAINRAIGYPVLDNTNGTATYGSVSLTQGLAIINTTRVSSNPVILLSYNTMDALHAGVLHLGTIVPGTSFEIHSSNTLDESSVNWWLLYSTTTAPF